MEKEQRDRRDRQHCRHGKTDAPEAHEIEFRVIGNDTKEAHGDTFR
jgi:hypothetical protein